MPDLKLQTLIDHERWDEVFDYFEYLDTLAEWERLCTDMGGEG